MTSYFSPAPIDLGAEPPPLPDIPFIVHIPAWRFWREIRRRKARRTAGRGNRGRVLSFRKQRARPHQALGRRL